MSFPTTASGLKRMQEELKHLETVERPKISLEIGIARAHGDLRENAEYHAAKEKQGYIEGRILTLNAWIGGAEVIDVAPFKGQKKDGTVHDGISRPSRSPCAPVSRSRRARSMWKALSTATRRARVCNSAVWAEITSL